jgi:hypothetical protein
VGRVQQGKGSGARVGPSEQTRSASEERIRQFQVGRVAEQHLDRVQAAGAEGRAVGDVEEPAAAGREDEGVDPARGLAVRIGSARQQLLQSLRPRRFTSAPVLMRARMTPSRPVRAAAISALLGVSDSGRQAESITSASAPVVSFSSMCRLRCRARMRSGGEKEMSAT